MRYAMGWFLGSVIDHKRVLHVKWAVTVHCGAIRSAQPCRCHAS